MDNGYVGFVRSRRAISCDSREYLVVLGKSNQLWRQKAKNCRDWGTGAIYDALEHPIVHKWVILLHGSWLAAGKWVKVFHYINQLQFSIVRKTALSYDLLYFCLPAGRFTEVCVIVILQDTVYGAWFFILVRTDFYCIFERSSLVVSTSPG